jgi:hypothetical protein
MFKSFSEEDKDDPVKVLALNEKRDRAVEIFQKLAMKDLNNASISVKRQVSSYITDSDLKLTYTGIHYIYQCVYPVFVKVSKCLTRRSSLSAGHA